MKLQLMCLFISFSMINVSITAMNLEEAKNKALALIDQELHTAIEIQDLDDVKELIEEKNADVNSCDDNGSSPLLKATNKGAWHIVKELLKHDVDVNLADKQGWTPLFSASNQNALEIVKILLTKGADSNLVTNKGKTARAIAIENGYTNIVLALDAKK